MGIVKINNPKIELEKIVTNSSLTNGQKEIWYNFIHIIAKSDAIAILETLQEDEKTLFFLTENLTDKFNAITNGDKDSWKVIIEKEKKYIKSN
jgi:hypothetical protein